VLPLIPRTSLRLSSTNGLNLYQIKVQRIDVSAGLLSSFCCRPQFRQKWLSFAASNSMMPVVPDS
jgi:hypothetical protein